ncbi:hypothetical protein MBLNU459_g8136t1 [Dothideomycetes sp. NU459]
MAEAEESLAQRQARLRREKRNAKIQATGGDRLARITQLSGRPAPAPEDMTSKPANTAPVPVPASVGDPDEVDISEHHYQPSRRTDSQLAQLQQQQQQQARDPFGMFGRPPAGADAGGQDPMLAMMQQMLSGGGLPDAGNPNDPNNPMNELPPMLKAMLNGQRQTQQQQQGATTGAANLWRIVHAVFALGLALYIALTSTFNGSKLARAQSVDGDGTQGPRLFYLFATVELVLQSSRYFLEKGQLQGAGWLATIANSGVVPEPWAGYVRVFGRYSVIWQTVVGDAVTIVFVLGALAWWRGMAIA